MRSFAVRRRVGRRDDARDPGGPPGEGGATKGVIRWTARPSVGERRCGRCWVARHSSALWRRRRCRRAPRRAYPPRRSGGGARVSRPADRTSRRRRGSGVNRRRRAGGPRPDPLRAGGARRRRKVAGGGRRRRGSSRSRRGRCRTAGRLASGASAARTNGAGAAVPVRASHPDTGRACMVIPHAGARADGPRRLGARGGCGGRRDRPAIPCRSRARRAVSHRPRRAGTGQFRGLRSGRTRARGGPVRRALACRLVERGTGLEPATACLEGRNSTN